jgi:hypothetical protein
MIPVSDPLDRPLNRLVRDRPERGHGTSQVTKDRITLAIHQLKRNVHHVKGCTIISRTSLTKELGRLQSGINRREARLVHRIVERVGHLSQRETMNLSLGLRSRNLADKLSAICNHLISLSGEQLVEGVVEAILRILHAALELVDHVLHRSKLPGVRWRIFRPSGTVGEDGGSLAPDPMRLAQVLNLHDPRRVPLMGERETTLSPLKLTPETRNIVDRNP